MAGYWSELAAGIEPAGHITSANGRTRIWGTKNDGEALGLQPMHSAVAMPDSNSKEPANPAQLLATMDLRTFPRFPESAVQASDTFILSCEVAAAAAPGSVQFQKDGFRIAAR